MTLKIRGYTLVELIVAVGLFALIMTLTAGAYIIVIGLTARAQGTASSIDNLSFALETMTRNIRTGTGYNCGGLGDCSSGSSNFSFRNAQGTATSYSLSNGVIMTQNTIPLTDPSVKVTSLMFYASGTKTSDNYQPNVTIVVSGTVSSGRGTTQSFSVETGATMRGSDIAGIVSSGGSVIYTAGQSGNWTVPSGVTSVIVTMWGGGGSGSSYAGGGGGGAGVIYQYPLTVTPGQISYAVGYGGAAVTGQVDGNDGQQTTFGSLIASPGLRGHNYNTPTDRGYGGRGGNASDSTNTGTGGLWGYSAHYAGYDGSSYPTTLFGGGGGGYGGYAGGDDGVGGASYSNTHAAAGATIGGGGGASYGTGGAGSNTIASAGTDGGGGGGSWTGSYYSGAGGDGKIIISW
ncbi:MAG: glycine-rich domain-containing protein [Minisyncoccia bacterium]|jgi:prepilin-type N-terminal cleavage/methylation domain-containing protein